MSLQLKEKPNNGISSGSGIRLTVSKDVHIMFQPKTTAKVEPYSTSYFSS